jgi:FXSXX-COOH protein
MAVWTGITMNVTEGKQAEVPTALVDLRRVPLAEMPGRNEDLRGALERLVHDALPQQVPVAAFNSAI